jgi:ABC-2 type transport system ATP-binding protein
MRPAPLVELDALTAREPPHALSPITASLDAGVHAFLGAREDGVGVLLAAIAGRARARSGRVRVLGASPTEPAIARGVAYVPREPALLEALRVREVLEIAAQVRREPPMDPVARLQTLGIVDLLERKVESLTLDEARAVAVCEAVTSLAKVVLLDEPYARIDPRAASNLAAAVRGRAADGGCIVVATASPREATELATDLHVLDKGSLVRATATASDLLARSPRPARFRVVAADARALVAALAAEAAIASLEADGRGVVATGAEPLEVAAAIARAALRAGVELESLRAEAPTREELLASLAGDAQAAFEISRARARRAAAVEGGPA